MSRRIIQANVLALTKAAAILFEKRLILPGLILLYSGVDIMASLDRPQRQEDTGGKDFIRWVDRYLLPNSKVQATAVDLYGARCGLVHTYTPQSRLSRMGGAREIYYAWGTADSQDLQRSIDRHPKFLAVAVHVDDLLSAFTGAVRAYMQSLSKDRDRARIAYGRAQKFFGPLSIDLVALDLEVGGVP